MRLADPSHAGETIIDTNELIPTLALVTLGLGLAAGVGGLLYFLRKR
jgi:hypothetical protein